MNYLNDISPHKKLAKNLPMSFIRILKSKRDTKMELSPCSHLMLYAGCTGEGNEQFSQMDSRSFWKI